MEIPRLLATNRTTSDPCVSCNTCCIDNKCATQRECDKGSLVGYIILGTFIGVIVILIIIMLLIKCKKEYRKFQIAERDYKRKKQFEQMLEKCCIIKGIPHPDKLPPFKNCSPGLIPASIDEISISNSNIYKSKAFDFPSRRKDQYFTVYDFRDGRMQKTKSIRDQNVVINIEQINIGLDGDTLRSLQDKTSLSNISRHTESYISSISKSNLYTSQDLRSDPGNGGDGTEERKNDIYSFNDSISEIPASSDRLSQLTPKESQGN
ncbi:unnamed protein product [Moneuplotes crassus]|uniref:Uncharacterized protein n=1 Tax=Euplotes crassus TaxID=5936 RepID=A0AAD2D2G3_EUPCR|nr:unnamed protein product [Moneuplotes crassus]